MKKFFLLLLAASSFAANSIGQGSCVTDIVYQQLKQQHPEIAVYEAQLEAATKMALQHIDISSMARTTAAIPDTIIYDIPIVVHVVHDYSYEYLSDDAIFTAVSHWAQVYMCQNTDTADVIDPFKKYVGNPRMRLHLATIDPNGNPTKGITHERSYLTNNADDQAKIGGWPQDKYINIWFINKFGASMTGAAAYAYYPSSAASMPYYDGVIGLYNYLDYDKAIPHEIGHVLNLEHPWGNTNNPGVACVDDEVDDTPPTMGHNPVGCVASALYDVTCATGYSKTYKDIHGLDSIADYPDTVNAQNIMDYTYCQKMFTIGQTQRMRAALTNTLAGRNNLFSPSNLTATGALAPMPDLLPVADYSIEKGIPSTAERAYFLTANNNTYFIFRNRSWNDTITSVAWTFSNAASSPTISSTNTVMNKFSQPGWVTVSVTATGNNTGSTTLVDSQSVYVADTTAVSPWNYRQNFTSAADISNWPMFNYYKNNFKWELFNGAGYDDGSCLRYRSYDYRTSPANATGTPVGDFDDIITPAFNMASITGRTGNVNINFYTSGSYRLGSGGLKDSLQVLISTNGGSSWVRISSLTGTALINTAAKSTEFIPTSGQWIPQTIAVPSIYCTGRTYIKLRYWPSASGNNLYLDKFQVSPYTTDVNEIANNTTLVKIFPNPTHGDSKIIFTSGYDGKCEYIIRDITGKIIYQAQETAQPNTLTEKDLSKNLFPSQGVYLVTVTISDKTITQKIIVD